MENYTTYLKEDTKKKNSTYDSHRNLVKYSVVKSDSDLECVIKEKMKKGTASHDKTCLIQDEIISHIINMKPDFIFVCTSDFN
jgi:hypothetical protein